MKQLTHLSLFSGIGGLDLAAEWAGLTTIGQCEWADYPTRVLEKHWPDVPRWRDIKTLTGEDFYERTGRRTVDVISGGFPCQPFSVAGKRRGENDERYLFDELLRVAEELQAKYIIGENVIGIDDGNLDRILKKLEDKKYQITGIFETPACLFGAPHERYRTCIVAHSAGQPGAEAHKAAMQNRKRWSTRESTMRGTGGDLSGSYWSVHKPPVSGMDDGLPYRMDVHRARNMTLGNAVVPQQFYPVFKAIADIELLSKTDI